MTDNCQSSLLPPIRNPIFALHRPGRHRPWPARVRGVPHRFIPFQVVSWHPLEQTRVLSRSPLECWTCLTAATSRLCHSTLPRSPSGLCTSSLLAYSELVFGSLREWYPSSPPSGMWADSKPRMRSPGFLFVQEDQQLRWMGLALRSSCSLPQLAYHRKFPSTPPLDLC